MAFNPAISVAKDGAGRRIADYVDALTGVTTPDVRDRYRVSATGTGHAR